MTKTALIDTFPVFKTKTAKKPHPLGRTYHKIPKISTSLLIHTQCMFCVFIKL